MYTAIPLISPLFDVEIGYACGYYIRGGVAASLRSAFQLNNWGLILIRILVLLKWNSILDPSLNVLETLK